MESTVINQAQENANPQQAAGSNNTTGHHPTPLEHEEPGMHQQRFRSGGGHNPFFFDMDDPRDFFTNPALRTRLRGFQPPFNSVFGQRKRRTSPPPVNAGGGGGGGVGPAAATAAAADHHPIHHADPYHDDFFASHFDAPHWNNEPRGWPPMNGGRKRMQEHHPDRNNNSNADMFNYIPEEFRQYMPEHVFQHRPAAGAASGPATAGPRPHPPPPQQQQIYSQRTNSGDLRRPQFCDMGIQTDDLSQSGSGGNLPDQQQPEGSFSPQYQQPDAPHHQQNPPQSGGGGGGGGFARSSADVGVGSSPNGSFASANAYSSAGGGEAGDGQRQTRSNSNSMGNVRRVPIIVEGGPSSFPKESYMPHRGPPARSQQQQPEAPPKRQHHPAPPAPPPAREVPIQRATEPPSPSVESINKIQDIQQDVLDLMFKVEQYKGGNKNDKEYKYLDEMLTRNLLKLDTIDTRGNDSIRLARKEAIKCIQASLSVLEAKLGEQPGKVAGEKEEEEESREIGQENVTPEASKEAAAEEQAIDKSKIPIPLPPIPGQLPPPTIRDCNSDEEEGEERAPTYVSEKKVELKTNK